MVWLINLATLFENLTYLKYFKTFYHSALIMPFIVHLFKKIHTGFDGLPPLFIL